ncbi:MAG: tetratricopeptide repeat protein [Acidobacteria bacterium]|nr:MAG: tetratricopeptide repeat protein [Acidobacteriota bacterium]
MRLRRLPLAAVCLLALLAAADPSLAGRGGFSKSKRHAPAVSARDRAGGPEEFTLASGLVAKIPAVAEGLRAVEADPGRPEAWRRLGHALASAGDFEDAIRALRRLVEIEPDNPDNYVDLGAAYLRAGRPRKGMRAFEEALAIEPFHALAYYDMGVAYQELGRYDDAIESFRKALIIEPELGDPTKNVGAANNPDLPYVKLRVYLDTAGATPALFTFSNPSESGAAAGEGSGGGDGGR